MSSHTEKLVRKIRDAVPKTAIHYFAGPPNSGKTHESLERLRQTGGAFASPLVGLAEEIFRELDRDGKTSLRTGRRTHIVESPSIIVGTYECLRDDDYAGRTLVIDEVEFATTRRGHAIASLLASIETAGAPAEIILIGPDEAGAIRALQDLTNYTFRVKNFVPLSAPELLSEPVGIGGLEPCDCLCVLSFKDLKEASRRIHRQRTDLTVLYLTGADSATSRQKLQAYDKWQLGHLTIATTAVSHGMNWAFGRMVFDLGDVDFEELDPWTRRVLFQMAHRVARGRSSGEVGATTARGADVLREVMKRNVGAFELCLDPLAGDDEERDRLHRVAETRMDSRATAEKDGPLTELILRAIRDYDGQRDGHQRTCPDQDLPGALEAYIEATDHSDDDLRLLRQVCALVGADRAQEMAQGEIEVPTGGHKAPGA